MCGLTYHMVVSTSIHSTDEQVWGDCVQIIAHRLDFLQRSLPAKAGGLLSRGGALVGHPVSPTQGRGLFHENYQ